MKKMEIDILGIAETRWTESGESGKIVIQYCTQVDRNTEIE